VSGPPEVKQASLRPAVAGPRLPAAAIPVKSAELTILSIDGRITPKREVA
jgi:hypothetical protein